MDDVQRFGTRYLYGFDPESTGFSSSAGKLTDEQKEIAVAVKQLGGEAIVSHDERDSAGSDLLALMRRLGTVRPALPEDLEAIEGLQWWFDCPIERTIGA
jgi:hypothetical protein